MDIQTNPSKNIWLFLVGSNHSWKQKNTSERHLKNVWKQKITSARDAVQMFLFPLENVKHIQWKVEHGEIDHLWHIDSEFHFFIGYVQYLNEISDLNMLFFVYRFVEADKNATPLRNVDKKTK